jgi:hypothetical protein
MPDITISLSDDRWTAFAAYVAYLQDASEATPPPFPPVTPVASVADLAASFLEVPGQAIEQWYSEQSEEEG